LKRSEAKAADYPKLPVEGLQALAGGLGPTGVDDARQRPGETNQPTTFEDICAVRNLRAGKVHAEKYKNRVEPSLPVAIFTPSARS